MATPAAWQRRLQARVSFLKWKKVELAAATGIERELIYKYLSPKTHVAQPRGDTLDRLADAIGVSRLWLKEGIGPEFTTLPIVGYVSAGEAFIPFDDHLQGGGFGEICFEIGAADPIAIEVRGPSMAPVYRPGDRLICSRRRGIDMKDCIGRDCVVMTAEDEGYIKVLQRGSAPDLYTLESYNRAFEPMTDRTLRWAAPVLWVRRPD